MRVAYFTDCYLEVNGVATTSRKLVDFAESRQLPMLVVHCGPERRTVTEGSVTHVQLRRGWASFSVERDLAFDLALWRERSFVVHALKAFRPDVIHITSPGDVGLLGLYFAHSLKIPLIASWHTNLHEYAGRRLARFGKWAPVKSAEKFALKMLGLFYSIARVTLAPNPEWVEWLAKRSGRPSFLMSRGVDAQLFHPSRRRIDDRVTRIGYVGRISPEKNVRCLVEIHASLKRAGHKNFRFVVVGDGSELPWLREHLKDAEFAGVLRGKQLAETYANMDLFLFPSHTDTFGNVVQEAMASGVVPIVSARGGPKYIVDHGISGFVAHDDDEFAVHAGTLLAFPARLALMRRAAREKAETASWDRVFEKVYEAYRLVAAHRSAGDALDVHRGRRVSEPA